MGAICKDCNKDMLSYDVHSCTAGYLLINKMIVRRDTTYYDDGKFCHDCGILNNAGNIHHFGCVIERCPECGKQVLYCKCEVEAVITSIIERVVGGKNASEGKHKAST